MYVKFVAEPTGYENTNTYGWYTNIIECKEASITSEIVDGDKMINVHLDNGSSYSFQRYEMNIYLMNNQGKTIDAFPALAPSVRS